MKEEVVGVKNKLRFLKKAVEYMLCRMDPKLGLCLGQNDESGFKLHLKLDKGKSKLGLGLGRSGPPCPKIGWRLKHHGCHHPTKTKEHHSLKWVPLHCRGPLLCC